MKQNHFDAIVVGAGIAGASLVYALAKRKLKILLLESKEDFALEASGNPVGLIYPHLTKNHSIEGNFSFKAFEYILKEIENTKLFPRNSEATKSYSGVLLLPRNNEEKERYLGAIKAYPFPTNDLEWIFDSFSGREGFLFKKGLAISPRLLVKNLLHLSQSYTTHKFFHTYERSEINESITVTTDNEYYTAEFLFLAHSNSFLQFPETSWIPICKVRGQLISLPEIEDLKLMPCSYIFGDYLTQDLGAGSVLGASYDEFKMDAEIREEENFTFLQSAIQNLPGLSYIFEKVKNLDISNLKTRVSYRSQSQDRRPVFGKLPDILDYQNNVDSSKKSLSKNQPTIRYLRNIFVLGALGSRGLTHALLAAETIIRDALEEKHLLTEDEYSDFKPDRFLLRNWKRGIR